MSSRSVGAATGIDAVCVYVCVCACNRPSQHTLSLSVSLSLSLLFFFFLFFYGGSGAAQPRRPSPGVRSVRFGREVSSAWSAPIPVRSFPPHSDGKSWLGNSWSTSGQIGGTNRGHKQHSNSKPNRPERRSCDSLPNCRVTPICYLYMTC